MEQVRQNRVGTNRVTWLAFMLFFAAALGAGLMQQSRVAAQATLPVFNIWHGTTQTFGDKGNPQTWINIVGSISNHDQLKSYTQSAATCGLRYTVNGQTPPEWEGCLEFIPASPPDTGGPTGNARLAKPGDFNVDIRIPDIPFSPLQPGANSVVITATTTSNATVVQEVIVHYVPGNVWPLAYGVTWNGVSSVQDVAQVVDGKWGVQNGRLRPIELGYDRLAAIGDLAWTDYEVTVPITFHYLNPAYEHGSNPTRPTSWPGPGGEPGFGIMMRWHGHNYDRPQRQPALGWEDNNGALAWFRWNNTPSNGRFRIAGNVETEVSSANVAIPADTTYIFKVRAITRTDGEYYYFKYWLQGQAEPADWQLTAKGNSVSKTNGSLLLVAHHVDVSFGDLIVQPVAETMYTLSVGSPENGAIQIQPDPALYPAGYPAGTQITATATADPDYKFDGWTGDLAGSPNPAVFAINGNLNVNAAFIPAPPEEEEQEELLLFLPLVISD